MMFHKIEPRESSEQPQNWTETSLSAALRWFDGVLAPVRQVQRSQQRSLVSNWPLQKHVNARRRTSRPQLMIKLRNIPERAGNSQLRLCPVLWLAEHLITTHTGLIGTCPLTSVPPRLIPVTRLSCSSPRRRHPFSQSLHTIATHSRHHKCHRCPP